VRIGDGSRLKIWGDVDIGAKNWHFTFLAAPAGEAWQYWAGLWATGVWRDTLLCGQRTAFIVRPGSGVMGLA